MHLTMRCFQLPGFGRALVPIEKSIPEPIGSEVLLKVLASGVCHSALHIYAGSIDLGN